MDPSALLFVAVAVAWAVYLVPKAVRHHDEAVRSRSVDRFSHTMRVLARREPVGGRNSRLVVTPGRPASTAVVVVKGDVPAPLEARRQSASRAARRRRRVLGAVLILNGLVLALAAFGVLSWWYVAAPVTLLVAWLVACRLMVRQERSVSRRSSRTPPVTTDAQAEEPELTEDIPVAPAAPVVAPTVATDPALWDPVPVTLPTYVTKPVATRRTVRTIDLDASGVWTSGRSESDSQLARAAEQTERDDKAARVQAEQHRAVGS